MSDILKRPGTFVIDKTFISDRPEIVVEALRNVLVVSIIDDFVYGQLKYTGYSKHFDIIDIEKEEIPSYMATVKNDEKDIEIMWIK